MKSLPLEVNSNKILLAFSKVVWCSPIYWVNDNRTSTQNQKPTVPSINGVFLHLTNDVKYIEHLRSIGYLDRWTPEVVFQLTANHSMRYTGEQAIKLERAYRTYLLSRGNKHSKRKNKPCNQQKELL